jgi:hypothetical protein
MAVLLAPQDDLEFVTPAEHFGGVTKELVSIDRAIVPDTILDGVKQFIRVDHDEEDDLLRQFIDSACSSIEDQTGLAIRAITTRWKVKDLPSGHALQCDPMPVQNLYVTDSAGTDITAQCQVWAHMHDYAFMLIPPEGVKDFTIDIGAGVFSTLNIWVQPNVWTLPDVWSLAGSTGGIYDVALIRQAIYYTVSEYYRTREISDKTGMNELSFVHRAVLAPLGRRHSF